MDWTQLILQLGISGLIVWAGYKIARLLIERWASNEAKRTEIIGESFSKLVGKVEAHHTSDLESHRAMGEAIVEVSTKLDVAFGLTPVRGVREVPPPEDEDTDPESPHAIEAQSAPTKPRPPTNAGTYALHTAKRRA